MKKTVKGRCPSLTLSCFPIDIAVLLANTTRWKEIYYQCLLSLFFLYSLRWKLGSVTASHFLSSYCSSFYLNCLLPKRPFRASVFVSYCTFFLDLLSSFYEYHRYTASLQADACFLAACHALNLRYAKERDET